MRHARITQHHVPAHDCFLAPDRRLSDHKERTLWRVQVVRQMASVAQGAQSGNFRCPPLTSPRTSTHGCCLRSPIHHLPLHCFHLAATGRPDWHALLTPSTYPARATAAAGTTQGTCSRRKLGAMEPAAASTIHQSPVHAA